MGSGEWDVETDFGGAHSKDSLYVFSVPTATNAFVVTFVATFVVRAVADKGFDKGYDEE